MRRASRSASLARAANVIHARAAIGDGIRSEAQSLGRSRRALWLLLLLFFFLFLLFCIFVNQFDALNVSVRGGGARAVILLDDAFEGERRGAARGRAGGALVDYNDVGR